MLNLNNFGTTQTINTRANESDKLGSLTGHSGGKTGRSADIKFSKLFMLTETEFPAIRSYKEFGQKLPIIFSLSQN